MRSVYQIIKKECKEIVRDRGTLTLLFLPILIFPLLSVGMSAFSENSNGSLKIAIHEKEHLNAIINNYLLGATEIEVIYSDNPIELLRNNEVDCIIE